MKIKDIAEWSPRWSTPLGTTDANAPVADGLLVDLNLRARLSRLIHVVDSYFAE